MKKIIFVCALVFLFMPSLSFGWGEIHYYTSGVNQCWIQWCATVTWNTSTCVEERNGCSSNIDWYYTECSSRGLTGPNQDTGWSVYGGTKPNCQIDCNTQDHIGGCNGITAYCGANVQYTSAQNFLSGFSSFLSSSGMGNYTSWVFETYLQGSTEYRCMTALVDSSVSPVKLAIIGDRGQRANPSGSNTCIRKDAYDALTTCQSTEMSGTNSGFYGSATGSSGSTHGFTDSDQNGTDDDTGIAGNAGQGSQGVSGTPSNCIDVNQDGFNDNTGKPCITNTSGNSVNGSGTGIAVSLTVAPSVISEGVKDALSSVPASVYSGGDASGKSNLTYSDGSVFAPVMTSTNTFINNMKQTQLFSLPNSIIGSIPSGGDSTLAINGGSTFGNHTYDIGARLGGGLDILKAIFLVSASIVSLRIITKGGG